MVKKRSAATEGPLLLLLALAALPFIVRFGWGFLGFGVYWAQSSYKLLLLFAPVYWRRRYGGDAGLASFWPVNEPRPAPQTWLLAILAAVALASSAIAAVLILAKPLGVDPSVLRSQFDARFGLTPLVAVAIVAYLFTINAALEELHYRAWLDRELSRRWGNAPGIAVSATAFAALHLFIFAPIQGMTPLVLVLIFVGLTIAGIVWSLIARRPGGIHAAWLSHGLTDAGLLTWGLAWLGYFA